MGVGGHVVLGIELMTFHMQGTCIATSAMNENYLYGTASECLARVCNSFIRENDLPVCS